MLIAESTAFRINHPYGSLVITNGSSPCKTYIFSNFPNLKERGEIRY